jgi:cytidine deaminase
MNTIDWDALLSAATLARSRAHAPFSRFDVGAAVLANDGRVFTGSNIEVSSYGLTLCAERLAIGRAVHEAGPSLRALALLCDTEKLVGPCGACRQFLWDFLPNGEVLLANVRGDRLTLSVRDLLPYAFGPSDLLEGK